MGTSHSHSMYPSHSGLIYFYYSSLFTNSQRDELPVGLIAQLAEHCTGIAVVNWVRITLKSEFFQALFSQLLLKLCAIFTSFPALISSK